jgi:hypothetical protein
MISSQPFVRLAHATTAKATSITGSLGLVHRVGIRGREMTARSGMDLCEILPPGNGSSPIVLVIIDGRLPVEEKVLMLLDTALLDIVR